MCQIAHINSDSKKLIVSDRSAIKILYIIKMKERRSELPKYKIKAQ